MIWASFYLLLPFSQYFNLHFWHQFWKFYSLSGRVGTLVDEPPFNWIMIRLENEHFQSIFLFGYCHLERDWWDYCYLYIVLRMHKNERILWLILIASHLLTKDLFISKCLRMERWLVKFVGFSKGCDQNGDRVSRNNKKLSYIDRVRLKHQT